jgi:hypothetical protein
MFTVKEEEKVIQIQIVTSSKVRKVTRLSKCLKFKWIPLAGTGTALKNPSFDPSKRAMDPKVFNELSTGCGPQGDRQVDT